jgi:hypothetical protein
VLEPDVGRKNLVLEILQRATAGRGMRCRGNVGRDGARAWVREIIEDARNDGEGDVRPPIRTLLPSLLSPSSSTTATTASPSKPLGRARRLPPARHLAAERPNKDTYQVDELGEPQAELDDDGVVVAGDGPYEPVVIGEEVVVEPLGVRVAVAEAEGQGAEDQEPRDHSSALLGTMRLQAGLERGASGAAPRLVLRILVGFARARGRWSTEPPPGVGRQLPRGGLRLASTPGADAEARSIGRERVRKGAARRLLPVSRPRHFHSEARSTNPYDLRPQRSVHYAPSLIPRPAHARLGRRELCR